MVAAPSLLMRFFLGEFILLMFGIAGCQAASHSTVPWTFVIANRAGEVLLVSITADDLFHHKPVTSRKLVNTKDKAECAFFDNRSGYIATSEEAPGYKYAVRIYDRESNIRGEIIHEGGYVPFSCPAISPDGTQVVAIDPTGSLIIAKLSDSSNSSVAHFNKLWSFDDKMGSRSSFLHCVWMEPESLAVGLGHGTYLMPDVLQAPKKKVDGEIVGVSKGACYVINADRRIVSLDITGKEIKKFSSYPRPRHHYSCRDIYCISPCGLYFAYDAPDGKGGTSLIIQHMETGKEVRVPGLDVRSLNCWQASEMVK